MDKRIEDYLHLYYGVQCFHTNDFYERTPFILDGRMIDRWNENCELPLRPLPDMTAEEAVKLCSIYSPEAFGDFRFSKWVAVRDEANFCYNVTNEKSDMSFHVDIEEMHIKVYEDGNDTCPGLENHTYFTEYLRMEFDVFGLIPAGLAIDKTKMNTNG